MLLRIVVAIGLIVPISLLSAAGYIAIHPIPIVLMFHSVVPQPQGVDISPEGLASILGSAQAARDHVIATTDSSDRSVYEVFAPRVLDRQFTAILFLMPPLMDRNGMMTWDEVRELIERDLLLLPIR